MKEWYPLIGSVFVLFIVWRLANRYLRKPKNDWNLKGVVVVVTGASRGVGKGIAESLGAAGATVYVTGRSISNEETEDLPGRTLKGKPLPGTITETAENINKRGGIGIPVKVDHTDDSQIKELFKRVEKEQGRMDILVNNVLCISGRQKPPFWEQGVEVWDSYHNVGLRSHYVACCEAVPLMLKSSKDKPKMIVNINSIGAKKYMFNVAYGTSKAALDRMSKDMSRELKSNGITCVSLWPGVVKTERMLTHSDSFKSIYGVDVEANGETAEFTGRAICALASDKKVLKKTGGAYSVEQLSYEYNFTDIDGRRPPQLYSIKLIFQNLPGIIAAFSRRLKKQR